MTSEIVKVQRPLSSSHPSTPWLIYDKGYKHVEHNPEMLVSADVKAAIGKAAKGYFSGVWADDVGWTISERVKGQDW
jgi:hypothetical protein